MKVLTAAAPFTRFVGVFALCVLALAIPAQAVTVYSTDFETPTFTTGNLHGQDSWQASTWTNYYPLPGGVTVTPSIQTGTVANGTQAMKIPLQDDANEVEAAWRTFSDYGTTDKIITITQNVYFSALDESTFDIRLSGSSTVTNFVEFTMEYDINLDPIPVVYVNGASTGANWAIGAWESLKIVMDFANELTDVYYNSIQIADDVAFQNSDGFEKYSILSLYPGDTGSEMYLDDLDITAVPEPTCLVLLGFGMSACLVRRRKSKLSQ